MDLLQDAVEPVRYEQFLLRSLAEQAWHRRPDGRPYHFVVGYDGNGRLVRYFADGDGFCSGLDTVWWTDGGRWYGRRREAGDAPPTFRTRIMPLGPTDVLSMQDEVRLLPRRAEHVCIQGDIPA